MFNIEFTRNGREDCTTVIVSIQTNLQVEKCVLGFSWECTHQYASALLQQYLQKQLDDTLSEIRKRAYQRGLKDGRGKKRILTQFGNSFRAEYVGW